MTRTMSGTVEEIIREVFIQRIPLSTKAHVELEVPNDSVKGQSQERTAEERLAAWQAYVSSHSVSGCVVDDNREAIYAEDEDRG